MTEPSKNIDWKARATWMAASVVIISGAAAAALTLGASHKIVLPIVLVVSYLSGFFFEFKRY